MSAPKVPQKAAPLVLHTPTPQNTNADTSEGAHASVVETARLAEIHEERRRAGIVLNKLRTHKNYVLSERVEAENVRSDTLIYLFERTEQKYSVVENIQHAVVDVETFHHLGKYSRTQAQKLFFGLQLCNVQTYTDRLVEHMNQKRDNEPEFETTFQGPPSINLHDIGNGVWGKWKTVPAPDFMHGLAAEENSIVAERRGAMARKGRNVTRAEEVVAKDVEDDLTDQQVRAMRQELKKHGRVNFWVFVLDPESFSRSIENLFHFSFLVQQRVAAVDFSVQEPTASYLGAEGGQNLDGAACGEMIVGFDRGLWKEMVRLHRVRRCMFPRPRFEADLAYAGD